MRAAYNRAEYLNERGRRPYSGGGVSEEVQKQKAPAVRPGDQVTRAFILRWHAWADAFVAISLCPIKGRGRKGGDEQGCRRTGPVRY